MVLPGTARAAVGRDVSFSISIPVFRQAEFLPIALKSVEAQTVPVELAVLDASPDDSAQRVIQRWETMIAYRYHHPDEGQAAAIQAGWDHTKAEIVAWLNADDYYFPDALSKVAAIFDARPEIDVVYGHAVHVSPEGDFQMYFPAIDPDIAKIAHGCIICQPSCFVRRRAVERVGSLNTTLQYAMDWDLWLRLYRAGCSFYFLDEPLSAVRIYPETKTLSGAKRRYQEIGRILEASRASWLRRIATLMSFRYYDLRNRRGAAPEQLGYRILAGLARLRNWHRSKRRLHIRGIECWTNRVDAECVVDLPWYGASPPSAATVVADRPVDLSLVFNGRQSELESHGVEETGFLGARITGHRYRARLPRCPDRLLSVRLQSRSGAWRLLSLKVRESSPS